MFSEASPSEASAALLSTRKLPFARPSCTTLGWFPPTPTKIRFEVDGADAAREFCLKHQVALQRADRVYESIALHTSAGIASRMAAEIVLVHLGVALDFLGLGLDQVPPQVLEEILAIESSIRSENSSIKSLICRAIEGSFINLLFLYNAQKF